MNLEYYRVFYYVAQYRNITAAAHKLSLSQPSVTKSIQRLEEDLDCQLFFRTKRGVSLTAEGKSLWKRIEPAYQLIMSAERELEAAKSLNLGTVSIAATEMGFGIYVLPTLQSFLKSYPNIKVRFHNALTESTVQMLKSGVVDLAILYSPFEPDGTMQASTIDVFHECLVAGKNYAFLAEKENSLSDLISYPFISMPEGSSGKEYMSRCFQKYGLIFEPDIEVTTMELVIQAAMSNLGIGTLPHRIVRDKIRGNELFYLPLKENLPERQVYVVTNLALPVGIAARAFIEHLRSCRCLASPTLLKASPLQRRSPL
ncbi:MAG: LysR family transcriptional regulator [Synergistaceae bacterium]|nr:LysR family transcriptional regulator [Synergistaceae bacterium]